MKKVLLSILSFTTFLLGAAMAATTAEPSIGGDLIGPLLPFLLGALGTGGLWLIGQGGRLISAQRDRIKIKLLQDLMNVAWPIVQQIVEDIWTSSTSKLKAASADGRLSPSEAKAAFNAAIREVWAKLPDLLKAKFIKAYGSEEDAKAKGIGPIIEQALTQTKTTSVSLGGIIPGVPANLGLKPTLPELNRARQRISLP